MADNPDDVNSGLEARLEALTALMQQNLDKVAALEAENTSIRVENQSLKEKVSRFYDLEFLPDQAPPNRFRTAIPSMQPLSTPEHRPSDSGKGPRQLNALALDYSVLTNGDKDMPTARCPVDPPQLHDQNDLAGESPQNQPILSIPPHLQSTQTQTLSGSAHPRGLNGQT